MRLVLCGPIPCVYHELMFLEMITFAHRGLDPTTYLVASE